MVVQQGARWRIRIGENIPLLGTTWLKDGLSLSTASPMVVSFAHVKVKDIIDQNIAQLILNTPLHPLITEDELIWKAENSGHYSVRSAYRLCVTEIVDNSHLYVAGNCNLIWKLKVPPKMNNLVWRVCRGCFPTRARLSDCGIHCPTDCVLCGNNFEDTIHVLLECPDAIQVWRSINLWADIDRALSQDYNMTFVIFQLLRQLNSTQSEIFVKILWSLWKRRNLKLCQHKNETNTQVIEQATHLLEEWRAAQIIRSGNVASTFGDEPIISHQNVVRWEKPASVRLTCNIDASFSSSLNRVGLGICICDDSRAFVMARIVWFSPLCDVDVGEVIGLHTALKLLADLQLDDIDFVLDSKKVVDSFRAGIDDSSEFGCILSTCSQLFFSRFQKYHVEFSKRQANGAAHELAHVSHLMLAPIFTLMYRHVFA